jgi:hypothetical protein
MAQVLAAVPVAGLDAVLVAVELVLEAGTLSAEHVLNVVARLTATEPPPSVETSCSSRKRLSPIRRATTVYAAASRRSVMRDLMAELKELRLHGMANAWADLTAQG